MFSRITLLLEAGVVAIETVKKRLQWQIQARGFQLLLGFCQPEHCLAPSNGHLAKKPHGGIFLPVSTVTTLRSLLEFASSAVTQLAKNFPPFMETGRVQKISGPYAKPF